MRQQAALHFHWGLYESVYSSSTALQSHQQTATLLCCKWDEGCWRWKTLSGNCQQLLKLQINEGHFISTYICTVLCWWCVTVLLRVWWQFHLHWWGQWTGHKRSHAWRIKLNTSKKVLECRFMETWGSDISNQALLFCSKWQLYKHKSKQNRYVWNKMLKHGHHPCMLHAHIQCMILMDSIVCDEGTDLLL